MSQIQFKISQVQIKISQVQIKISQVQIKISQVQIKGVRLKFWNFLYYWSDLTEIFTQYVKSKKKHLLWLNTETWNGS